VKNHCVSMNAPKYVNAAVCPASNRSAACDTFLA
jgi:hypothetical protein